MSAPPAQSNSPRATVERKGSVMLSVLAIVFLLFHSTRCQSDIVPKFEIQPSSFLAMDGEHVELKCVARGTPTPTYEWMYGSRKSPLTLTDRIYTDSNRNALVFAPFRKSDVGVYYCRASNRAGGTTSELAYLDTAEKPQLSLAPQNRTTIEGANASFGCGGEGYPPPGYRWTKAHPSTSNFQPHNESHFTIARVSPSDAGQYTCNIFNKAGSIAVSAWLRVEYAPRTSVDVSDVTRPRHDSATFACEFESVPRADVTWTKDGAPLVRDRKKIDTAYRNDDVGTSTLVLDRLHEKDTGTYACVVKNRIGERQSNVRLTVQVPPKTPVNFNVSNVGGRQATLSWSPGHWGHSRITNFTVFVEETGANAKKWTKHVPDHRTSVIVTGLRPATHYMFFVLASNGIGAGEKSEGFGIATSSAEPDMPVLTGGLSQKESPYKIKLNWSPGYDGGRPILRYEIHYTQSGKPTPRREIVDGGNVTSVVLSGLESNTSYAFRISAANEHGLSNYSKTLVVATRPLDLPGRVSDVDVTIVDGSAVVSWTVPDQLVYENRKITEYVVTLTPKRGEALTLAIEKPFSVGPDGRLSGSLKDVDPGEYGVAIHAEDDEGRKSEEIKKLVDIRDSGEVIIDPTDSATFEDGNDSLASSHVAYLAGGIGAAVAFALIIIGLVIWRQRQKRRQSAPRGSLASTSSSSTDKANSEHLYSSLVKRSPVPVRSMSVPDNLASVRAAFENAASPPLSPPPPPMPIVVDDMLRSIGTDLPGEECFMSRIGSRVCSAADLDVSMTKLALKEKEAANDDTTSLSVDGASESDSDIVKEKCVKFVDSPVKQKISASSPLWRPSNQSYTQRGIPVVSNVESEPDSYV